MTSLATFLMSEGKAEEAGRFYAGLFGAELANVRHHPDGKLHAADLSVAGQRLMLFDSPVEHAFGFTPAISLFVDCDSADEVDRLRSAMAEV